MTSSRKRHEESVDPVLRSRVPCRRHHPPGAGMVAVQMGIDRSLSIRVAEEACLTPGRLGVYVSVRSVDVLSDGRKIRGIRLTHNHGFKQSEA